MATERDEYGNRLSTIYAEQYAGLRSQLAAVDRNVLRFITEGRERGDQIDTMIVQLGICANELTHIKFWGRVLILVIALLCLGVIALMIKVF
jgi:hypothetical protein